MQGQRRSGLEYPCGRMVDPSTGHQWTKPTLFKPSQKKKKNSNTFSSCYELLFLNLCKKKPLHWTSVRYALHCEEPASRIAGGPTDLLEKHYLLDHLWLEGCYHEMIQRLLAVLSFFNGKSNFVFFHWFYVLLLCFCTLHTCYCVILHVLCST